MLRFPLWTAAAPVFLVVLVAMLPARSVAGRVSCALVLKEIDRVTGRRGNYRPDAARIARRLGVEPAWVHRCAQVYGRRLDGAVRLGDEEREDQQERWEEVEPEERTGEDTQEVSPTEEPERRPQRASGAPTPGFGGEYGYE
jgi:hypothetical protein